MDENMISEKQKLMVVVDLFDLSLCGWLVNGTVIDVHGTGMGRWNAFCNVVLLSSIELQNRKALQYNSPILNEILFDGNLLDKKT